MTQISRVLDHLKSGKTITSIEAIKLYGATRLSAIIWELRRDGYDIASNMIEVKNRYGEKTHVAEYRYVGE